MKKELDQTLLASLIDVEELYQNAPCGYISILPDGTIIKVNNTMLKLIGFEQNELVGKKKFAELFSKGGQIHYEMFFIPLINLQGAVKELSYDIIKRDRKKLPVLISANTVKDDNTIIAINISIFDITERKKYEQELLDAKRRADTELKRKDEFIHIASHELKTPITSLKAYHQILELMEMDDLAKSFVQKSTLSLNNLEFLIANLLDISVINSGQLYLAKSSFDLRHAIEECVELVSHSYASHEIVQEWDRSRPFYVYADRQRIMQVMINLISNAIKYSPGADKVIIKLTVDDDGKSVTVSIQDFGVGIASVDQQQIFQKYFRVENKVKSYDIQGFGLGLYIIQNIIQLHQSKIYVESQLNIGSTFSFALPLA